MTPVRLEPAAPRSRVKHSTTEPLRSRMLSVSSHLSKCETRIWLLLQNTIHLWCKDEEGEESKEEGKDQELIQSSTIPNPG